MDIDGLTYGQLKEIAAMFGTKASAAPPQAEVAGDSRPVIVRCRDAGVHFGHLLGYSGRTVRLKDARRMWQWSTKSGLALNGCATNGIDPKKSKIDSVVENIVLLEACEIIDCTPHAAKTISEA
jgi:hypothetical protein